MVACRHPDVSTRLKYKYRITLFARFTIPFGICGAAFDYSICDTTTVRLTANELSVGI
jgi:hypothetical protein